jgi:hypothetical protein
MLSGSRLLHSVLEATTFFANIKAASTDAVRSVGDVFGGAAASGVADMVGAGCGCADVGGVDFGFPFSQPQPSRVLATAISEIAKLQSYEDRCGICSPWCFARPPNALPLSGGRPSAAYHPPQRLVASGTTSTLAGTSEPVLPYDDRPSILVHKGTRRVDP